MADENWRTIGDMTRRDEMTNKLAEPTELERVKAYVEHGPVGSFNLQNELEFIFTHKRMTTELYEDKMISEERYLATVMTLSARLLRLKCYEIEMFERYGGV